LLLSDTFGLAISANNSVCQGMAAACKVHTVTAGQTVEQIAATYGTTISMLVESNQGLALKRGTGLVALHPYDVLAVLPAPREEMRWLWDKTSGGTAMQRSFRHFVAG
jgi:hypothetical protein